MYGSIQSLDWNQWTGMVDWNGGLNVKGGAKLLRMRILERLPRVLSIVHVYVYGRLAKIYPSESTCRWKAAAKAILFTFLIVLLFQFQLPC